MTEKKAKRPAAKKVAKKTTPNTPAQKDAQTADRLVMLCKMLDKMNVGICDVLGAIAVHQKAVHEKNPSQFNFTAAEANLNKTLGGIVALQRLFTQSAQMTQSTAGLDISKLMPSMNTASRIDRTVSDVIGPDSVLSKILSGEILESGVGNTFTKETEKQEGFFSSIDPWDTTGKIKTGLYRWDDLSDDYDTLVFKAVSEMREVTVVCRFGDTKDIIITAPEGRALRLMVATQGTLNRMYDLLSSMRVLPS